MPRWIALVGLWLLLSIVFASQLYLAGYVTPWPRAFAAEAVYWLSWALLAPAVFWMCRRLYRSPWTRYVPALLLGAVIAATVQPLIPQLLLTLQSWLHLCVGQCEALPPAFSRDWLNQTVRVAGVNLPVYAGFVLAWHAAHYYRESRDRQLQAMQLESLLHQAQLQALRSQLNPHFLFNALHSIAELVHENPKLAEALIVRLGELLRQVLQSSASQEVTLAEELGFIRSYVEIEQMRLGERLQVTWDVDESLRSVRVPSLILQPLVENAIQHGIAASARAGALTIRARSEAGFLVLEVRDTGPGMSRESAESGRGIGLSNTRLRLQRLYGERQKFDLFEEDGVVVTLRIPLGTP
ncbi:MAG TPA: histidine kinase [Steroidobacteraceae bacterium]|nr:histidine kinase [Steroidobacteraceae bacterium]